ncbi:MAG: ATP-dependent nuclease, partial [Nitrosopumilaceae archaeon]
EPVVFSYVRHKLAYDYHRLRVKIGTPEGIDPIDKFDNSIFKSLNNILKSILGIRLYLNRPDDNSLNYVMNFLDEKMGRPINVTDLSAGEKGIIHFIFSIYGFDLENGVMIIDEPELHLHPQIQEKYIDILNKAIDDMKMQFIVATHSPILVNSKTISNVKRFYKNENEFTQVITSQNKSEHHNLVKYLDYTKATQIMFSNHVVMVEGESDGYVFQHYYENYKERKLINRNLNFIHIVGKDSYNDWKKFFDDWKITSFFIRDLDNFGGGDNGIQSKYLENIYILKQGKLETYIGKEKSEKFQNAVDFCETRYSNWFQAPKNADKIIEWDGIFGNILSKL